MSRLSQARMLLETLPVRVEQDYIVVIYILCCRHIWQRACQLPRRRAQLQPAFDPAAWL